MTALTYKPPTFTLVDLYFATFSAVGQSALYVTLCNGCLLVFNPGREASTNVRRVYPIFDALAQTYCPTNVSHLHDIVKSILPKKEVADSTPHYQPGTFLNLEEVVVYKALSKVFDANTKVFTKVWLAELVASPKPERHHLAHWRRVQRRRLDFLICSASTFKPILAIKLETELDSKKRHKGGPGIVEEVLEDIGVPLLR